VLGSAVCMLGLLGLLVVCFLGGGGGLTRLVLGGWMVGEVCRDEDDGVEWMLDVGLGKCGSQWWCCDQL